MANMNERTKPDWSELLRAGYARNAVNLRKMEETARTTGKLVGGFTADYLKEAADEYERLGKGGAR